MDQADCDQVKAHDVRAFAASKAFQSGVSLEQILSACHWKSHNTFTQFWIDPSSLIDLFVQSELCATIWTGLHTLGRTNN